MADDNNTIVTPRLIEAIYNYITRPAQDGTRVTLGDVARKFLPNVDDIKKSGKVLVHLSYANNYVELTSHEYVSRADYDRIRNYTGNIDIGERMGKHCRDEATWEELFDSVDEDPYVIRAFKAMHNGRYNDQGIIAGFIEMQDEMDSSLSEDIDMEEEGDD